MKKNIKTILLLLPLAVAGLAGCGGKGGGNNNNDGSKVTIKFWHTFGQTVVDGLKEKIRTFSAAVKEHDGVDVDVQMIYQGGYPETAKKITDGYSVGNKPTIAVSYPDSIADYLEIAKSANDDFVVNLDTYINDEQVGFGKETWLGDEYDETDFVEDFYNEGSVYSQEGTYSLPYMKSTEIMFYNMKLLKKALKLYDTTKEWGDNAIKNYMKKLTWNDFIQLCAFIKEHKSEISNVLEVPTWYDSDANFFVTKLYQDDIPYSSITEQGTGAIEFGKAGNKEKVVEFLESVNDMQTNGLLLTKGIKNKYGSDFFTGEKCMFSIGSSGGSGYNFPQADAFQLEVCRVPASFKYGTETINPLYVTQGPTLAIFSDNGLDHDLNEQTKLYAWKFVKYITNGKVNAELCVNGSEGYVPVRNSAYETEFFQEFMAEGENYAKCYEVVLNDINNGAGYVVSPVFKGSAALREACGSLLTAAATAENKASIPGLIDEAIDAARQKM